MPSNQQFFECKFPIIAVPMNKVSDLKLAVAVSAAGGFPSISLFNYVDHGSLDLAKAKLDLEEFKKATGHCNLIYSINTLLLDTSVLNLVISAGVTHVEIISSLEPELKILTAIARMKAAGIKIIYKALRIPEHLPLSGLTDAVIIKSSGAAGRVGSEPVESVVIKFLEKFPSVKCVPSGGISTSQQVTDLLKQGATAVGIGTLFALSAESCVSLQTKNAIIDDSTLTYLRAGDELQAARVFSSWKENDDVNHTQSLKAGVAGLSGHLFVGRSAATVKEIITVEQIIKQLTESKNDQA